MGRGYSWWRTLLLVVALGPLGWGQEPELAAPLPVDGAEEDEQVDVLARGPVHEAFAEQVSPDPTPGLVVAKAPPEAVEEVPPDWKPEGSDVLWVPGYWFWDEDRSDYVWVSGVWRRVPPERRWVPGYWQAVDGGWQWVSGFWGPTETAELEYVETPPETLETGPSSPAPGEDHFWIPGTWQYSVNDYRWRPGYWYPYRDDWTWISARYVWTPRGCVYIPGYWDYTLARRGFLFAPVYFRAPLYLHVGYRYRPRCWIGYDALLTHLFVQPYRHHLYFGDYYAPIYRHRHYIPCYDYHRRHYGYASLFGYYEHYYRRQGIDYHGRMRDWHNYYVKHEDRRPRHSFRMDETQHMIHPAKGGGPDHLVHRYRPDDGKGPDRIGGHRIERVVSLDQNRLHRVSSDLQNLARDRRRFEEVAKIKPPGEPGRKDKPMIRPEKFTLPKTAEDLVRKTPSFKRPELPDAPRRPLASGDRPMASPQKRGAPGGADTAPKNAQAHLRSRDRDALDSRPRIKPADGPKVTGPKVTGPNDNRFNATVPGLERRRPDVTVPDLPRVQEGALKTRDSLPKISRPRLPLSSEPNAGGGTGGSNVHISPPSRGRVRTDAGATSPGVARPTVRGQTPSGPPRIAPSLPPSVDRGSASPSSRRPTGPPRASSDMGTLRRMTPSTTPNVLNAPGLSGSTRRSFNPPQVSRSPGSTGLSSGTLRSPAMPSVPKSFGGSGRSPSSLRSFSPPSLPKSAGSGSSGARRSFSPPSLPKSAGSGSSGSRQSFSPPSRSFSSGGSGGARMSAGAGAGPRGGSSMRSMGGRGGGGGGAPLSSGGGGGGRGGGRGKN